MANTFPVWIKSFEHNSSKQTIMVESVLYALKVLNGRLAEIINKKPIKFYYETF